MNRVIKEKQDLTYLSWSKIRNSSGTAGSFLKSYSELGGKKKYYKLSNFDREKGVSGHECVNEIIVDRLLEILGVPHLNYQLIHGDILIDDKVYEVHLCCSDDFKAPGDSKLALDAYVESTCEVSESPGWNSFSHHAGKNLGDDMGEVVCV